MTFLLSIFVLLLLAIIMGSVFEYYGLPSVIGELIAGFILGKAVLDLVLPSSIITGISEISLFFIVLLIGVESTTYTLVRNVKKGILLSATSFIIPLLIMLLFLKIFYGKFGASDIILAVSIGVPSISIISVLLNKYDLMKYEMGNSILASVIFTERNKPIFTLIEFKKDSVIGPPSEIKLAPEELDRIFVKNNYERKGIKFFEHNYIVNYSFHKSTN